MWGVTPPKSHGREWERNISPRNSALLFHRASGYWQTTAVCNREVLLKCPLLQMRTLRYRKVKWLVPNNMIGVCLDVELASLLSLCPDMTWDCLPISPCSAVCYVIRSSSFHFIRFSSTGSMLSSIQSLLFLSGKYYIPLGSIYVRNRFLTGCTT